jgi:DNA-binding transcriptional regulator YdaS (Cro superfamily)
MASGKAPIPHDRAVKIEQITNFAVTRREMFPQKWHLVWPELIDDDHQPDIDSLTPEPRAEAVTEQAA